MMRKISLWLARPVVGLLLCAYGVGCAYGQVTQSCAEGFKIAVDFDYVFPSYGAASGVSLQYQLQDAGPVSSAWVEIWDGGLQLLHQQVPVKPKGRFVWRGLREVPETPSDLNFAIFDPDLPLTCTDSCSGPLKGGIDYLSAVWVGNSPEEAAPFGLAADNSYRLPEGSGVNDLALDGLFVGSPTKILLEQQDVNAHWVAREYLPADVLDRNHIKVQIPPGYLAKSGAVGFSNYANRPEPELGSNVEAPQQILYVASKDSPVLSSVYPSEVSPTR
jgi:hypothetical protein